MRPLRSLVACAALCLALVSGEVRAQEPPSEPPRPSLLFDVSTGTLLASDSPRVTFQPASLAKLMTATVVFEALAAGEIDEDTAFTVSEHAWRTGGAPAGGTTMFARLGSDVPVLDLLKGLLVHNANDAAIVLAEGLAGSEPAFAERMNALAQRLGMTHSHFVNPTGYEAEGARTSAADMGRLASHVLSAHAGRYALFSLPDFTWNGIFQRNKNPLIGEIAGLDGFTAGRSETSGFHGVGSVLRDGRRLIGVVAGHSSAGARLEALRDLFESLEKDFEDVILFDAGEPLAEARVFGGEQASVPLVADGPVEVLLPRGSKRDYRLRVVYDGPLKAPVAAGAPVGELRVLRDRDVVYRVPLRTADEVAPGTLTGRAADALRETLFGWWLDES